MEQFRRMSRMAFFVILACLFSLGCESKEDRLIKQREERNKEIDSYLEEAEEKRIAFIEKTKREQYIKRIKEDYFQTVKNIEYIYEQNIENIKHYLKLRKMEIAEKQGADTWKNKMQRLEVEEQYQDGKISKHERKRKLLLLDQELERITERAKIEQAKAELSHSNELEKALKEAMNFNKETIDFEKTLDEENWMNLMENKTIVLQKKYDELKNEVEKNRSI